MADFLYLFRGGLDRDPSTSPEALQKQMQKWVAWMGELSKTGNLKGGERLEGEGRQLVGKSRRLVDGPYTESKDLVGGYIVVQAKDLSHATEIARGCPIFDVDGNVEIRPIAPAT
jgi:hypothetical protein